jgi:hypothetical protein
MRHVPSSLKMKLVLGGMSTRMGWWWMGLVCWTVVAFLVTGDLPAPTYTREDTATVERVEETQHDGRMQYLVQYRFKDKDGYNRGGTSLSTQRPALGPHPLELTDGGESRLVGMVQPPDEVPVGTVVLVAAAGFLLMLFEIPAGLRRIRFLRRARWQRARVTNVEPPAKRSKASTLSLELDDGQATHTATVRIAQPGIENARTLDVLHDAEGQRRELVTPFDLPPGTLQSGGTLAGNVGHWLCLLEPVAALTGLIAFLTLQL